MPVGALNEGIQTLARDSVDALMPLIMQRVYESGPWTPAFGGAADGTITYGASDQVGSYVRVGALVVAWCNFLFAATVTVAPSPVLLLRGLPFPARSTVNHRYGGYAHQFNIFNLTAGCIDLTLRVLEGGTTANFMENFDNAGPQFLAGSAISSGSFFSGAVIYETE